MSSVDLYTRLGDAVRKAFAVHSEGQECHQSQMLLTWLEKYAMRNAFPVEFNSDALDPLLRCQPGIFLFRWKSTRRNESENDYHLYLSVTSASEPRGRGAYVTHFGVLTVQNLEDPATTMVFKTSIVDMLREYSFNTTMPMRHYYSLVALQTKVKRMLQDAPGAEWNMAPFAKARLLIKAKYPTESKRQAATLYGSVPAYLRPAENHELKVQYRLEDALHDALRASSAFAEFDDFLTRLAFPAFPSSWNGNAVAQLLKQRDGTFLFRWTKDEAQESTYILHLSALRTDVPHTWHPQTEVLHIKMLTFNTSTQTLVWDPRCETLAGLFANRGTQPLSAVIQAFLKAPVFDCYDLQAFRYLATYIQHGEVSAPQATFFDVETCHYVS